MELKFKKLEYYVRKTPFPIALTWPHIIYVRKKTKKKKYTKQNIKTKNKTKQKQTKISYHMLHQCTLHAFITLLSKVLEREIIQIKFAVVFDMGQRDDITKSVNVGLHSLV